MASTNKTTNLELSQFIGSDSPKWLTDYNADMEKIDAGYQTVKAQADATDLIVGGHTSSISSLQSTVTEQGTAISGLRTDVTANSGSINTINSLIGNGEPTTTDKTIIGAINELAAEIEPGGGVSAASVSYDNTTSGLTATNVQAAIDEVNNKIPTITTDSSMSSTSKNAVQNKVIKSYVDDLIKLVTYTYASATSLGQWNGIVVPLTVPTGYSIIGCDCNFGAGSTGSTSFAVSVKDNAVNIVNVGTTSGTIAANSVITAYCLRTA